MGQGGDVLTVFKQGFMQAFSPYIESEQYLQIPASSEEPFLEGQFSYLADGTRVPRMYTSDTLENKRIVALNALGTRWLCHPANKVGRGSYEEAPVAIMTRKNYFLTDYFDKIRNTHLNRELVNG